MTSQYMIRLLAVDTATSNASVAVCQGTAVLSEGERQVTTHSEGLLQLIDETLRQSGLSIEEIDAFVCGRGPGSFTGLRIGLATVKGLCFAAQKPLLCISSLLPLALAAKDARSDNHALFVPVIDARRKEIFWGLYRRHQGLQTEAVCRPEMLGGLLPETDAVILVGDGALAYQEVLKETLGSRASLAPDDCHQIKARYLALAALERAQRSDFDDLAAAVPLYIRASDAKLPQSPFAPKS